MGRKLMRVPLTFRWPLNKVWGGYLNPFAGQSTECVACGGTGSSPDARRFHAEWYGYTTFNAKAYGAVPLTIDDPTLQAFAKRQTERTPSFYGSGPAAVQREALRLFDLWRNQWCHQLIQADVDALVAHGRLPDFTRVARTTEQKESVRATGGGWLNGTNGYTPTAAEVNAWSMDGMGHDSINSWVCIKARCVREGVGATCSVCEGRGVFWPSAGIEKKHEEWTWEEPPTGDGYQLWETTSDGSPISPVFRSLDLLADWCADNATVSGYAKTTAAKWYAMLDDERVESVVGNVTFI